MWYIFFSFIQQIDIVHLFWWRTKVLAASPSHTIGVDLSDIRQPMSATVDQFFDLMTQQFTEKEWLQILDDDAAPSEMDKLHLFYRFWSLKESYIKAIGVGLQHDLQRLNFTLDASLHQSTRGVPVTGATLEVDGALKPEWAFHQSYLDDEHVIAVASSPPAVQEIAAGAHEEGAGVSGNDVGGAAPPVEPATPWQMLNFSDLISGAVPQSSTVDDEYWTKFSQRKVKKSRRWEQITMGFFLSKEINKLYGATAGAL